MISDDSNREFEHRERPVTRALVSQLQSCVPDDWGLAVLDLDVQWIQPGAKTMLRHRLYHPGNRREITLFPQALCDAASRYHALCCEFGHSWIQATVVLVFNQEHQLSRHEMHFVYPTKS